MANLQCKNIKLNCKSGSLEYDNEKLIYINTNYEYYFIYY